MTAEAATFENATPMKAPRPVSKGWWIPFLALSAIAIYGAVHKPSPSLNPGGAISPGDTGWMLTATALVLLMTPGLSFFYGGMVARKNVISTMLQSFIAMGLISLLLVLFALFQLKFAIITPALITGSFAERVRFSSYMLFICLFSIFIYCPLAHMTWHPEGIFHKWGVLDFAGGTVVHMSAGLAALAGALVLGRRKVHVEQQTHAPSNIPFVILGTGMLWFGWFGFNAGSALAANETAALAFLSTNTASAAAMLAWIFVDGVLGRKPSALGACVGAVVGLVAITPAAGFVSLGASIFIGAFASIVSNLAVNIRTKSRLDDTLDVFPCHGLGGIVGMILTGVFAQNVGLVAGESRTFLYQMLAMVIASIYSFCGSYLLYKITDFIIPLRVDGDDELLGLDISQHGEQMWNPIENVSPSALKEKVFTLPRRVA